MSVPSRPAVLAAVLVSLVAGCTAASPSAPPERAAGIHVDQINRHDTLDDLRANSEAVIVGKGMSQTATTVSGFPVTVTTVQVVAVVAGSLKQRSADIHQLGTEAQTAEDTAPLLKPGNTYLLYLSTERSPTGGPDRLVIVGGDGVYQLRDNIYRYAGGPGTRLPPTIDQAALDRLGDCDSTSRCRQ